MLTLPSFKETSKGNWEHFLLAPSEWEKSSSIAQLAGLGIFHATTIFTIHMIPYPEEPVFGFQPFGGAMKGYADWLQSMVAT